MQERGGGRSRAGRRLVLVHSKSRPSAGESAAFTSSSPSRPATIGHLTSSRAPVWGLVELPWDALSVDQVRTVIRDGPAAPVYPAPSRLTPDAWRAWSEIRAGCREYRNARRRKWAADHFRVEPCLRPKRPTAAGGPGATSIHAPNKAAASCPRSLVTLEAPTRMERDSGSVTVAFHGCRSAVGADRAPADAWFSSARGVSGLTADTPRFDAKQERRCGRARCATSVPGPGR
jgi:hypothetical protein